MIQSLDCGFRSGMESWICHLGASVSFLDSRGIGGSLLVKTKVTPESTQGVVSMVLSIWSTLKVWKTLAMTVQHNPGWQWPSGWSQSSYPSHSALERHQREEHSLSSAAEASLRGPPNPGLLEYPRARLSPVATVLQPTLRPGTQWSDIPLA